MKFLTSIFLVLSISIHAQLTDITSVNVGAYVDHTIVPLSPQSNYSHSQTIYYQDQLQFKGYINEISYFKPFSVSSTTNVPVDPADLTIKIGTTDIEEFDSTTGFIPDVELTEMTNILRSTSVYEVRYTFETPFYYDGTQNLVIDVEDLNMGASSSATDGYRGVENFGNPPKRSIISLTEILNDGTQSTSLLKINSYPQTKFYGNLQRCEYVSVSSYEDVLSTTATVNLNSSDNVTIVRYNITPANEDIPNTYNTTTDDFLHLTNLLPSQDYVTYVKSDCDEVSSSYRAFPFKTRPTLLTIPHTIDFEGDFLRDYSISPSLYSGNEVSDEAGNNSTYGIKMYGRTYPSWSSWLDYGNPFEVNDDFVRVVSLDVDLVNTTNPVLSFDLKQPVFGTYFRVKVNSFGSDHLLYGIEQDFVYQAISGALNDDFKKVVIDLSSYINQQVTLKLEHVSKSYTRVTYIDNIELKENDCLFDSEINSVITENEITLDWNSSQNEFEVLITPYQNFPTQSPLLESNLNHTFAGLDIASSYEVYVRALCSNYAFSPFIKKHISTKTTPLQIPFNVYLDDDDVDTDEFVIQYQDGADISNNDLFLFQKECDAQWIGGDNTTETQAWNDNKDFITGLKYRVDLTTAHNANMLVRFKLYHYYNSNPSHSWFRVMINGTQVGPSYNPQTKNSDPLTNLNIDLTNYIGNIIDVELQQVGRSTSFEGGGISGDGVELFQIEISGTLSNEDFAIKNDIKLYPNPVQDNLYISSNKEFSSVKMYDMLGKLIKTKPVLSALQTIISTKELEKGMYFVHLDFEGQVYQQKIIKK